MATRLYLSGCGRTRRLGAPPGLRRNSDADADDGIG
ncbi:hypothetical protein ABH941_007409 [Streptacidiphilus sp. EB103A]